MISDPFIRRPIATSLLAIGIILLGIVAYRSLGVASLPAVDLPTIRVYAFLPGASPETVASALAEPLEQQLGQIAGVTELTSLNTLGQTSIAVQFELGRDIDGAAQDVQSAISAAATALPKDLPNPPTYYKSNPAMAPLMILALQCDTLPGSEVYDYADQVVAQKLSQVDGVSEVSISGAEKSAVRVQIDPGALAAAGIGLEDVRAAIAATNVNMPKGSIEGTQQSWAINADDQLFRARAYRDLIVTYRNGSPVKLGDMGQVIDSVANVRTGGWYNNQRAVIVTVRRLPGANIVETAERVRALLPSLQRWIPPAISIHVLSDRTGNIRAGLEDVQRTLLIAVVLVVMVIFVFLRRPAATFIPSVTIPVSLAGTFGVMYLFGFTLDNLSLMALTVAVGFVVDDAIVMIENVARHRDAGLGPVAAALAGARQIGFTILSITVSLVAAFIPLFMLPGIMGRFFFEFAVTLTTAVVISGIVSLTLTPMMCARFLGRDLARGGGDGRLARTAARLLAMPLDAYRSSLGWVLRHRLWMLAVTLIVIVGTIRLYGVVPKGYVPSQETGIVTATTEASQDISFPAMAERQTAVVRTILADPDVESIGSFMGSGGVAGVSNGYLYYNLKPLGERSSTTVQVIDRLREKLDRLPGISTYMYPVQDFGAGARQGKGQYQYTLHDQDTFELRSWMPRVVERLKTVPELKDVSSDQQNAGLQATLKIDRDAASRLGILPQTIDETLYDAFGQRQVSTIYTPLNTFKVVLEIDPRFQRDIDTLGRIYVPAAGGKQVPLSAITRLVEENTPLSIAHQGQLNSATLSFNLADGVPLGRATDAITAAFEAMIPPGDLSATFEGNAKAFKSSSDQQIYVLIGAILVVYIVLGVLYESYIHPITILSTLPSAGLGALLALIVCGMDLSLIALIGLVLLIGIVKKNAIMMIDFALDAERSRGLPPDQAIFEACMLRFRPIMMTTAAAILGALPLALGFGAGSELRRPLGVTIVGGLLVSQVLTLYTTPVIYLYLDKLRRVGRTRKLSKPVMSTPAE